MVVGAYKAGEHYPALQVRHPFTVRILGLQCLGGSHLRNPAVLHSYRTVKKYFPVRIYRYNDSVFKQMVNHNQNSFSL